MEKQSRSNVVELGSKEGIGLEKKKRHIGAHDASSHESSVVPNDEFQQKREDRKILTALGFDKHGNPIDETLHEPGKTPQEIKEGLLKEGLHRQQELAALFESIDAFFPKVNQKPLEGYHVLQERRNALAGFYGDLKEKYRKGKSIDDESWDYLGDIVSPQGEFRALYEDALRFKVSLGKNSIRLVHDASRPTQDEKISSQEWPAYIQDVPVEDKNNVIEFPRKISAEPIKPKPPRSFFQRIRSFFETWQGTGADEFGEEDPAQVTRLHQGDISKKDT